MSRYINADELIMWIRKECLYNGSTLRIIDKISSMENLENPQVLCGLCLRWEPETEIPTKAASGLHKCRFLGMYTDETFYCALGELKTKGENNK